MTIPDCKFKLGEIVAKPFFTDSGGKPNPRIELLRVIEIRLIDDEQRRDFGLKPYYRIKATTDAHGLGWFEGAERFFEKLGGDAIIPKTQGGES